MKLLFIQILMVYAALSMPVSAFAAPAKGYTDEYCNNLKGIIDDLENKISSWRPALQNPNLLYLRFDCIPGEGRESCQIRCQNRVRTKCFYLKNEKSCVYVYPAHVYRQHESPTKLQQAERYSDHIKKVVIGGKYGYVDDWEVELNKSKKEYEENCTSKVESKRDKLFDEVFDE